MKLPLTGGCNCGAVRYEVSEPLLRASYCHCKRCQRRTGAAASAQAHPAPDSFRIVAGKAKLRMWKPPQGGGEKWFCSQCGSAIFGSNPSHPESSESGWEHSTKTQGYVQACGNTSPTLRLGNRSPMTAFHYFPRAATHPGHVRSDIKAGLPECDAHKSDLSA